MEFPQCLFSVNGLVSRILDRNKCSEDGTLCGRFGHTYTLSAAASLALKPAFPGDCLSGAGWSVPFSLNRYMALGLAEMERGAQDAALVGREEVFGDTCLGQPGGESVRRGRHERTSWATSQEVVYSVAAKG